MLLLLYKALKEENKRLVTMLGLTDGGVSILKENLSDKKEMPAWSVYQLHMQLESPKPMKVFDPSVKRHVDSIVKTITHGLNPDIIPEVAEATKTTITKRNLSHNW